MIKKKIPQAHINIDGEVREEMPSSERVVALNEVSTEGCTS